MIKIWASEVSSLIGYCGPKAREETIEKIKCRNENKPKPLPKTFRNPSESTFNSGFIKKADVTKIKNLVEQKKATTETLNNNYTKARKQIEDSTKTKDLLASIGVQENDTNLIEKVIKNEKSKEIISPEIIHEIQNNYNKIEKIELETSELINTNVKEKTEELIKTSDPVDVTEKLNEITKNCDSEFKKDITSCISKERGNHFEKQNLDAYEKRTDTEVNNRNTISRCLKIELSKDKKMLLIGKIDGTSEDILIESKNRQSEKTFGRGLTKYDSVQLTVYMKMFNFKNSKLIENYGDLQGEYELEYNDEEWTNIKNKLIATVNNVF